MRTNRFAGFHGILYNLFNRPMSIMKLSRFALAMLLALPALAGAASQALYNAETAHAKLAGKYPFIQIASAAVPAQVRVVRRLTYVQRGKYALQLDLYLPAAGAAPAPAVVLVHGGGWGSGSRDNLAPMAIRLAERGYAAATVSYRLSGQARYPAAVHDVKAAVRWVRSQAGRYGIDAAHIAVAGASAGGQIASLTGVTNGLKKFDPQGGASSAVQAIINIDGLSDFTSAEARRHEDDPARQPSAAGAWFGGPYAEKSALWREASPINYASKATPPILFIGSGQERFAVGREEMIAKLTPLGVGTRVFMLPDTPHSFWLFDPWLAPTVGAMADFLDERFARTRQPWVADLGNGSYQNPVLHADYSDPDAIRVGEEFYMTSSSFANAPGLPLLESSDLVNWSLVGHALPQLVPAEAFAAPQPGKGVWAPCLRYHDGKFWIFYPDPDFGVYVITAERFAGPWTAPHLLLPGKGIIDPTPLWDDDGKAYLLHAWARSRAGIGNMLTLRQMAPDGRSLLDGTGKVVIDGNKLPGYTTLEGPKFYKANGYYYVFAPAGGVEQGWQSVFRSRSIDGPYEDRIVMDKGNSPINGPHQGAWVDAADGSNWFLHFQDKRAYGRVAHLQPMSWKDGWPLIGADLAGKGKGEPVLTHVKPAGRDSGIRVPPTSDEFGAASLGLQWQWNANWKADWMSLDARPGQLRLYTQPELDNLRKLPSVLTQKPPAPTFTVDTKLELAGSTGDRAGLVLLGMNYAWLGLQKGATSTELVLATCESAKPSTQDCVERKETLAVLGPQPVYLRMRMGEGCIARFAYSLDNKTFKPAGKPYTAVMGRWVGAQLGLFAAGKPGDAKQSFADIDYFRVTP